MSTHSSRRLLKFDVLENRDMPSAAANILDTFNRPSGPELGASWSEKMGRFAIESTVLTPVSGLVNQVIYTESQQADVAVAANVELGGKGQAGLVARFANNNNLYLGRLLDNGDGLRAQIARIYNGRGVVLSSQPVAVKSGFLSFQVTGASLTLSLDGTIVGQAVDMYLRKGFAGVRGSVGSTFDDFAASELDDSEFADQFARSGPQLGEDWTRLHGNLTIEDGTLSPVRRGANDAYFNGISAFDVSVEAHIQIDGPGRAGLVVRLTGPNNYYLGRVVDTGHGLQAQILRVLNGNVIVLSSNPIVQSSGKLSFVAQGAFLYLMLDDDLIGAAADNVVVSPGLTGVRISGQAICDNFVMTVLDPASPAIANNSQVINEDGGWCWFQDERALIVGDLAIVGSVANGQDDPSRKGDVDITSTNLTTGQITTFTLHERFVADDHSAPALYVRPDGRILAMYTGHGSDVIYYRISQNPHDVSAWFPEETFNPNPGSRATYSNLHYLANDNGGQGVLYNFFRGLNNTLKPSWMYSYDQGDTWLTGGLLIDFLPQYRIRPYVKYASNGTDTIHLVFTEGHPRDLNNSIFYVQIKDGWFCHADGTQIQRLTDGPIRPRQADLVFDGDARNVAWTQDIHLDAEGRPVIAYSVQKNSEYLPQFQGGADHRYRYATFDGSAWHDQEIAFAGSRLYSGEDDYTGGIVIDPDNTDRVFISTNVDPRTGRPLLSGHYEIFLGVTPNQGENWVWTPITPNTTEDNIRPLVPTNHGSGATVAFWLRGSFPSYLRYQLEVVSQTFAAPVDNS